MSSLQLYPDDQLAALAEIVRLDDQEGLKRIGDAIEICKRDPRLYFLQGSILAGLAQYDAASNAFETALDISPEYHIARFQLGLLQLTMQRIEASQKTLQPLLSLPQDDYIGCFSRGLIHMMADENLLSIAQFQLGISFNKENAPLNSNIRLMITEMESNLNPKNELAGEESSQRHVLLKNYYNKSMH